jgi:peptide/nickel transport system substrate-binding protein
MTSGPLWTSGSSAGVANLTDRNAGRKPEGGTSATKLPRHSDPRRLKYHHGPRKGTDRDGDVMMSSGLDFARLALSRPGRGISRRGLLAGGAALGLAGAAPGFAAENAPKGQLTWGVHISLAPTWFDPAETPGVITPFMVMYALHDAVMKPMPGNALAPSLAESFEMSKDGLAYDFILREGVKFHNGDPVTAEDVKFSFERYKGTSNSILKEKVAAVEVVNPRHVRFRLKEQWLDFMTFYGTATGAGWIVPKKVVEAVGDEGFKRNPVGAGPYKFVSFTPGVELVLEAFEGYWRKTPSVKRLVFRSIPEESTRLAALKAGEIDIVYSIRGELAEDLRNTPGLTLKPTVIQGTFWLAFPDQWDPKSPWSNEKVRRAASLAIDRENINKALTLGYSGLTGNPFVPDTFDYYWQPPKPVYDPAQARKLLAEAGYANGFDGGEYYCDASYSNLGEAIVNNLAQVRIRASLRPLERAAFFKSYTEKQFRNLIQGGSGAFGNAATRLEMLAVKGGAFAYGNYPDLDELFQKQSAELDPKRREEILHKMQQIVHERTMYAPIWQLAFINGHGPRVAESGFGLIPGFAYTAPYEDITMKEA